jgi:hypothetical protein
MVGTINAAMPGIQLRRAGQAGKRTGLLAEKDCA